MTTATRMDAPSRRFVHPALLRRDGLRIGSLAMRYEDVASFAVDQKVERDWAGPLLSSGLYGLITFLVISAMLTGVADARMTIAAVFFGAIVLMNVTDALAMPTVTLYRLTLTLHDGRRAVFVDADPAVVETLAMRIEAAGARDTS